MADMAHDSGERDGNALFEYMIQQDVSFKDYFVAMGNSFVANWHEAFMETYLVACSEHLDANEIPNQDGKGGDAYPPELGNGT